MSHYQAEGVGTTIQTFGRRMEYRRERSPEVAATGLYHLLVISSLGPDVGENVKD